MVSAFQNMSFVDSLPMSVRGLQIASATAIIAAIIGDVQSP